MLNFYEMDQLLAQYKGENGYDEGIADILKKKNAAAQKAIVQPTLPEPAAQAAPAPAAPVEKPAVATPRKRAVRGKDPIPGKVVKPDLTGNTANIIPHGSVPDAGAAAGPDTDRQGLAGVSHRTRDLNKTGGTVKGKQGANLGDSLATLNSMVRSSPTYRFAAQYVMQKLKVPGAPPIGHDFVIVQKEGVVPKAGVAGVSSSEDRSGVPQVVIEDPALLKKVIDGTTSLYSMPPEKMPREFSILQKVASNAIIKDPTGGKNFSVNPTQALVVQRAVEFNRHLGQAAKEVNFQPVSLNKLAMLLGSMAGENQLGSDEMEIQHGVMPQEGPKDQVDNVQALVMLIKADQEGQYHTFRVHGPLGPSAQVEILPPQKQGGYDPSLSNKPVAAQAGEAEAFKAAQAARKARRMQQQGPPVESFKGSDDWSDLTTMMEHWGF